jgi:hypothetical protein
VQANKNKKEKDCVYDTFPELGSGTYRSIF